MINLKFINNKETNFWAVNFLIFFKTYNDNEKSGCPIEKSVSYYNG